MAAGQYAPEGAEMAYELIDPVTKGYSCVKSGDWCC